LVRIPSSTTVVDGKKYSSSALQYEEPVWSIEKVLECKKRKGEVEYCFVKWKGFPSSENSWIPARSIIER
jgi:hypothetical protein